MNFFLQGHAFGDLFTLIHFGLVIGLDDFDELFLAVDHNAAALVDVVGHPLHHRIVNLAVVGAGTGESRDDGNFNRVARRRHGSARVKIRHIRHFFYVK